MPTPASDFGVAEARAHDDKGRDFWRDDPGPAVRELSQYVREFLRGAFARLGRRPVRTPVKILFWSSMVYAYFLDP